MSYNHQISFSSYFAKRTGYNTYGELITLNDNVFGYTLNRDNIP